MEKKKSVKMKSNKCVRDVCNIQYIQIINLIKATLKPSETTVI